MKSNDVDDQSRQPTDVSTADSSSTEQQQQQQERPSLNEMLERLTPRDREIVEPAVLANSNAHGNSENQTTTQDGGQGPDMDARELAALLSKMDATGEAAKGLEQRLDGLLAELDSILGTLDSGTSAQTQQGEER
jgi:hypothetical protein